VERLEPLIHKQGTWTRVSHPPSASTSIDFVWETYCEKVWREAHNNAVVLNRLHNSLVLEDKSNFAFLQLRMSCPRLESYIALSRTALLSWCRERYREQQSPAVTDTDVINDMDTSSLSNESYLGEPHNWAVSPQPVGITGEWWAVKASKGNGGKDVWVLHKDNFETLVSSLPKDEEYVMQRYVDRPLLWNGYKFHFRCYAAMTANQIAYVYEKCFILCAGLQYTAAGAGTDDRVHLTNLSINKALPGHPGQVPCWLSRECPPIFEGVCNVWREVVCAAGPFMVEQRSPLHFEFVGLDILVDSAGTCHLLEVNRLPGLEASKNRCKRDEDDLYDQMMESLLDLVLPQQELSDDVLEDSTPEAHVNVFSHTIDSALSDAKEKNTTNNLWQQVKDAAVDCNCHSSATFKNIFSWKAFTKNNRKLIVVE